MKHYFNTNRILSVTALAIGAITIFFACKKDDKTGTGEQQDNQTIAAAQSEAEVNAIYEDAFTVTLDVNTSEKGLNGQRRAPGADVSSLLRCPDMTISFTPADFVTFPKIITIDFKNGCTEASGRIRKGKVLINVNKSFVLQGAIAVITFDNYYVNGIKVEGTQTVQNLSSGNGFAYSYTVAGGKLTYPDGRVVTYSGTRNVTQVEGAATPLVINDDAYEITGRAELKDSSVLARINITKPLYRKISCPYISKGTLSISVNTLTATIDYGNGDCTGKATLTVGDKTKVITLPK